jgi:hypothetical protein
VIYELRIYTAMPGRLPDVVKRFETVTLDYWKRYGIHQVGFWTTLVGPSNMHLTYMLQWESLAEREEKWNAFQADPGWIAARAASEQNGPILSNIASSFLVPTSFSATK